MFNPLHHSQPLKEYPKLKVFALHPGAHKTQLAEEGGVRFPDYITIDTLQLPAATMLYLTFGRLDGWNGKSVQCFPGHSRSSQSDELRYMPDICRPIGILLGLREIGNIVLHNKLTIQK